MDEKTKRTGKTEDFGEQKQGMKFMAPKNLMDSTKERYRTEAILLYRRLKNKLRQKHGRRSRSCDAWCAVRILEIFNIND